MNLAALMNFPLRNTVVRSAPVLPSFAQTAMRSSFPLGSAKAGDTVTIVDVKGGASTLKRVMAMGMADGTELKVLQHHNNTGVVVSAGDRRFALDMNLACRILVTADSVA